MVQEQKRRSVYCKGKKHPFYSLEVYEVVDTACVNKLWIYKEDTEIVPQVKFKPVLSRNEDVLVKKPKGIDNRHKLNYDPTTKVKTTGAGKMFYGKGFGEY